MPVTVGADPEFEVMRGERVINASDVLHGGTRSQLGTDGASSTGEIRPDYGTPEECWASVKTLLQEARNTLRESNYELRAGAGRVHPLGGHIHIGGTGRNPSDQMLHALDHFITIPLRAKSNHSFRNSNGYGRLSEVREQPHGWEYRAPCSWIAHPKIAKGVLSIAYTLASQSEETLMRLQSRDDLLNLMGNRHVDAEEFYATLDSIDQIENIRVFRAWELEVNTPPPPPPPPPAPRNAAPTTTSNVTVQSTYNVEFGDDALFGRFVAFFRGRSFSQRRRIIAAASRRVPNGEAIIFVPEWWHLRRGPRRDGYITVQHWERPTVGMSQAAIVPFNAMVAQQILDLFVSNQDQI